jgi:hypothetical protein
LLPEAAPEHEAVEVRRGKTAEDDEERETKSPRADKTAKQQIKDKLATAKASFGKWAMPKKEPANDNFRPVASWPLIDQLTRSTFEPDEERRTKSISTARYLRGLIDIPSIKCSASHAAGSACIAIAACSLQHSHDDDGDQRVPMQDGGCAIYNLGGIPS